jgi:hypothetical protein
VQKNTRRKQKKTPAPGDRYLKIIVSLRFISPKVWAI